MKPRAVVVDIDDTLDIYGGRPNNKVIAELRFRKGSHYKVIVLTNRSALRQAQTVRWLAYWAIPFDKLIMRPYGVRAWPLGSWKERAYRTLIAPHYDVELSIDNYAEPWRRLGVPLWLINVGSDNKRIARRYSRASA